MGYLGATLTQVFKRAHGQSGCVTQRCHNSSRWETGLQSAGDVTHRKRTEDFGNLKKVDMRPASGEDGWLSLARGGLGLVSHEMGRGGGRSQNKKMVPFSLCVEEPLNSKVIKSFVPELRSRYVFFEFRDSYVLSLWTFDVRVTHSHIMAMLLSQSRTLAVSQRGHPFLYECAAFAHHVIAYRPFGWTTFRRVVIDQQA